MARRFASKRKSGKSFNRRAGKTHSRNKMSSGRGGWRL